MPVTPMFGFELIEDVDAVDLPTLINSPIQSVEDKLPLRFGATIAEIAAMSGSQHPDGQIAVLTADNAGAKAGCTFTRSAGKWRFSGGQIANLATFISTLASNIVTQPGASFYDSGDDQPKVFIDAAGAWRVTAPAPLFAMVTKSSAGQNITTTVDEVSFQTLVEGDTRFWTAATPTKITIPETGRYLLRGQLRVNGGTIETAFSWAFNDLVDPYFIASAGDRTDVAWPTARGEYEKQLTAGDTVTMRCNRYGGVDTQITTTATWVQIRKVE